MHEYTCTARVWGLTCPGFPEEVSRARRWTRDILRGSPLAEDAELIVSELSANQRPGFRQLPPGACGIRRGLGMVSAIAHRVVVHETDGGHTITAELFSDCSSGGHPC